MIGKVKWFEGKKGYGFIMCEDGRELFVHYTGIVADGYKSLSTEKGDQAINVKVVHNDK